MRDEVGAEISNLSSQTEAVRFQALGDLGAVPLLQLEAQ